MDILREDYFLLIILSHTIQLYALHEGRSTGNLSSQVSVFSFRIIVYQLPAWRQVSLPVPTDKLKTDKHLSDNRQLKTENEINYDAPCRPV
jgi:hypothetical protein